MDLSTAYDEEVDILDDWLDLSMYGIEKQVGFVCSASSQWFTEIYIPNNKADYSPATSESSTSSLPADSMDCKTDDNEVDRLCFNYLFFLVLQFD